MIAPSVRSGTTRTGRLINCPETFAMTTIRYLAAVAGLLVLACCTRVENTHLSSPVLPMQEPPTPRRHRSWDLYNILHVGAAATPAVDALPSAARHGGASVHHGELPNAVTRAELVAYLHVDAISYVRTGAEAGFDEQLFPDGLLLRFAADPPIVRVAEGTPPKLVDEAVRVVQILNMALPRDWQIGFGDEPGPAGTAEPGPRRSLSRSQRRRTGRKKSGPPRARTSASPCRVMSFTQPAIRIGPSTSRLRAGEFGSIRRAPRATSGWASLPTSSFMSSAHPSRPGTVPRQHHGRGAVATARRSTSSTRSTARRCSRSTAVSSLAVRRTPSTSGGGADTSTHIYGVLGLPAGEVAFGAAFSNGLLLPWASGPTPDTALAENPRLAGTVRWSGRLLGLTPRRRLSPGSPTSPSTLNPSTAT